MPRLSTCGPLVNTSLTWELVRDAHSSAHPGPLDGTPGWAHRLRFKEPARAFLTHAQVSEPLLESMAYILLEEPESYFVDISLES